MNIIEIVNATDSTTVGYAVNEAIARQSIRITHRRILGVTFSESPYAITVSTPDRDIKFQLELCEVLETPDHL